ncbi:MAG: GNAT family N-acetyltransferase [Actinomycetia bacterium]|nr:GNAT family N-acetyltransferase [Actinomycetes bacterium]
MSASVTISTLGTMTPEPALVSEVTSLLGGLVASGAALGWVEPPARSEIERLLRELTAETAVGDASTVVGRDGQRLIGFGCWRRYQRPTHRPHADIGYVAVAADHQGRGVGRHLLDCLIHEARGSWVEQLTLDSRSDNNAALALWRSRGFVEYGRLADFVALGERRYDKTLLVLDLRTG